MNNLIELIPSDLTVQHLPPKNAGGGWSIGNSTGISVHHKPTNTTVELDIHRSQYLNKHEALIILKDLLTEFKVGDIIFGKGDIGEITDAEDDGCCYAVGDGTGRYEFFESIAHTEEGWRYKNEKLLIQKIDTLQDDYNSKVKVLRRELKNVMETKL